jgi:hypothetical protein
MEDTTTDEKIFSMTWKNFIVLQFAVVGITNTGNYLVNNQAQNTDKIIYNDEAHARRLKNQSQELDYKITIKDLKRDLKVCENLK